MRHQDKHKVGSQDILSLTQQYFDNGGQITQCPTILPVEPDPKDKKRK